MTSTPHRSGVPFDAENERFSSPVAEKPKPAATTSGGMVSPKGDHVTPPPVAEAPKPPATTSGGESAEVYAKRAATFAAEGDYDAAITDFIRAIELDPRLPGAYHNRGIARLAKGDYAAAIADYTVAIELDPRFAAAYCGRAVAHLRNGDHDKAWDDVQQCRRLGGTVHPEFLAELRKASGREE